MSKLIHGISYLVALILSSQVFAGNVPSVVKDAGEFVFRNNPVVIAVRNAKQVLEGHPECVLIVNYPLYPDAKASLSVFKHAEVLKNLDQCLDVLRNVWEVRAKIARALLRMDDLPPAIRDFAINCICHDVF